MDICKNCLNYLTAYKNSILKQLWFGHKDNYQDRIDVLNAFNPFIKRGFCCESWESIIGSLKIRKLFAENQLRLVEMILVLVVVVKKIKNVAK